MRFRVIFSDRTTQTFRHSLVWSIFSSFARNTRSSGVSRRRLIIPPITAETKGRSRAILSSVTWRPSRSTILCVRTRQYEGYNVTCHRCKINDFFFSCSHRPFVDLVFFRMSDGKILPSLSLSLFTFSLFQSSSCPLYKLNYTQTHTHVRIEIHTHTHVILSLSLSLSLQNLFLCKMCRMLQEGKTIYRE